MLLWMPKRQKPRIRILSLLAPHHIQTKPASLRKRATIHSFIHSHNHTDQKSNIIHLHNRLSTCSSTTSVSSPPAAKSSNPITQRAQSNQGDFNSLPPKLLHHRDRDGGGGCFGKLSDPLITGREGEVLCQGHQRFLICSTRQLLITLP